VLTKDDFQNSPGQTVEVSNSDGKNLAFIPDPLAPIVAWNGELTRALSNADRALGELRGIGNHLENPNLLIRPFLNREAVSSSRIEGTQAGIDDLYALAASDAAADPSRTIANDTREVLNYADALHRGIAMLPSLPVSLRLIRELHKTLLTNVRGGSANPGEFRALQNWIDARKLPDAPFVPPPVPQMKEALNALENYIHSADTTPPLVRIGLIHYQFEAIHPFIDGNGRVGRLLIPLLLTNWDLLPLPLLYISAFFEDHKDEYIDRLRAVSLRGEWNAFLIFFLTAVDVQARNAIQFVGELMAIRKRWFNLLAARRANSVVVQLADSLFQSPYITIPIAERLGSVTYPTASSYIEQLVAVGILAPTTARLVGSTARTFVAHEILNIGKDPSQAAAA
jgi:Fic family protein